MTTAPVDRKEEIPEVATELLQARSFSSFSYADLSARLGISKASIHHHFPTREAMACALVERFRESYRRLLVDLDRQQKHPWQRLEMFLGGMCAIADSGSKICPMGACESSTTSSVTAFAMSFTGTTSAASGG